ncbi:MAG: acetyl-CoA carboxylase biotin carboxyl carrier protein [Lentisphaeria bacterium]|nr:acetyl-CoA carboxylase biotin carboxyl carrier protein [Lentisphaeria bacterium]
MKLDEIKSIVKLMSENDLTEFKIESEDMHLCIRRGSSAGVTAAAAPVVQPQTIPAVAAPVAVAVPPPPAAPAPAPAPASASAAPDKSKIIESPIVGTFYRSSTPGSDAFVKVGSKVEADQTVCIIEAMKVMNEIKAEKSGVIKEILVENGEPVEFGQPLFVLE